MWQGKAEQAQMNFPESACLPPSSGEGVFCRSFITFHYHYITDFFFSAFQPAATEFSSSWRESKVMFLMAFLSRHAAGF